MSVDVHTGFDAWMQNGRIVFSTRPPLEVTDAAVTLGNAHGGRRVIATRAAGQAFTLPAATGSGQIFKLMLGASITSNSTTIKVANATDEFRGFAHGADDDGEGATGYTWKTDDNDDTITMNGSATGGEYGDTWELEDVASGLWLVKGFLKQSGGSEATPFSATVS